ncbi:hypothetical protein [Campylobacter fetus]|nr:hypothetical protein [Campylobacter fetus]
MGRVYNYFKHKWEDEFENEAIRVKKFLNPMIIVMLVKPVIFI